MTRSPRRTRVKKKEKKKDRKRKRLKRLNAGPIDDVRFFLSSSSPPSSPPYYERDQPMEILNETWKLSDVQSWSPLCPFFSSSLVYFFFYFFFSILIKHKFSFELKYSFKLLKYEYGIVSWLTEESSYKNILRKVSSLRAIVNVERTFPLFFSIVSKHRKKTIDVRHRGYL